MQWDTSFESDIPVIDHEHRELIDHIMRLQNEPNPERAKEILLFLEDYVVKHFAHEQLMHRSTNYPKAREHKETHLAFMDTVEALKTEYLESGCSPVVLEKIVNALKVWLRDHILGADKEFAHYYRMLKDD